MLTSSELVTLIRLLRDVQNKTRAQIKLERKLTDMFFSIPKGQG